MPRPEARIFIDGGARGNPGPAGFGVAVRGPGGEPLGDYFGYLGVQTNNVAEYRGLLAALEHARHRGWKRVWIGSDSELMVRQVRGEYRVKNEGLRPLFESCRALASGLEEFTIQHLRREENTEADELANRAMDRRASELPPGARAWPGTPAEPEHGPAAGEDRATGPSAPPARRGGEAEGRRAAGAGARVSRAAPRRPRARRRAG